jgi:single-strand DNA-binding protein
MLPPISGEFGIVADPELRFSDKGNAWVKVRCVAKDRVRDSTGAWSDGDPVFIDILINQGAEHLYESVVKGDTILVIGKLKQREYEVDGQKRTVYQIAADCVGVSVRWGTAKTQRVLDQSSGIQAAAEALGATEVTDAPF